MGKINSRRKGAEGERELSRIFREHGFDTKRGQQYCGLTGAADVVGLPGIYVECKRRQNLNLYDALTKSRAEAESAGKGQIPAVFHRKDRCEWLVTMSLSDWMGMYIESNLPDRE